MRILIKEILEKIVSTFSKLEEVEGILLAGSRSTKASPAEGCAAPDVGS